MSRLRFAVHKKSRKAGAAKTFKSKLWIFFLCSPRHSSFTKKMENYFPFLSSALCVVFFCKTREELKTNFLTPRQSRSSRGEESRARTKSFPDSVSCAFHFRAACTRPRRAENFLFDDFFPPKHLLHLRKKFLCRVADREHSRSHSRAAQRKLKILAPDASECAFYLLNCNFFGTSARKCL